LLTAEPELTYMLRDWQDLSENNLGRDASCCLAIGDALKLNHGLRSLLLARMTSVLHYHSPVDIRS